MKEKIEPHMELIHIAEKAMRKTALNRLFPQYAVEQTAPDCPTWDCPAPTFAQGDIITMENMNMYVWSLWNRLSILTEIVKSFATGKNVD